MDFDDKINGISIYDPNVVQDKKGRLVCSALKVQKSNAAPFIVMGKRHCDCLMVLYRAGFEQPFAYDDGFVTEDFEFMTRNQAYDYAVEIGQHKPNNARYIFSEDLW